MKFFLSIIIFFAHATVSHGVELQHSGHSIYVENNFQWEIGKDLFGIPFILFSPAQNGQRSNISFAHTGVELELEVSALKKNEKDYQNNKRKWAQTHSVRLKDFTPYESYLNSQNHRVHSIGVSYESEGKSYLETSYYTECKGQIVFSKGLRLVENIEHQLYFQELINSLDCGVL